MNIIVTGRIASGKSTLSNILYVRLKEYFKKYNEKINLINVDELGHDVLLLDDIITKLKVVFGNEIIQGNGISRKKLSNIVFRDSEKLKMLNAIVHPQIIDLIIKKSVDHQINIFDVALFYELKIAKIADFTILVKVDLKHSIERLSGRYDNEVIANIYNNQKIPEEYDFMLDTSFHDLKDVTPDVVEQLVLDIEKKYFNR